MALRLELENGHGSAERTTQSSRDRLYAQECIQELLPAFHPGRLKPSQRCPLMSGRPRVACVASGRRGEEGEGLWRELVCQNDRTSAVSACRGFSNRD